MSAEDVREAVGALKSALALAGLEYVEPALGTLTEHLERLERLNSELTLGQEYMEKWSDRGDFLCYRHEWLALEERAEAAEARVRELEQELGQRESRARKREDAQATRGMGF